MSGDEALETNGNKIVYTTRELLAELKQMITSIDQKLDQKAEKTTVEDLVRRVASMETYRTAEQPYATQIVAEFRTLQKDNADAKLAINELQTSKRDKKEFQFIWVPVIFAALGVIFLGIEQYLLHIA